MNGLFAFGDQDELIHDVTSIAILLLVDLSSAR